MFPSNTDFLSSTSEAFSIMNFFFSVRKSLHSGAAEKWFLTFQASKFCV